MNRANLQEFEKVYRQFQDLKKEVGSLSGKEAKSPHEAVSEIKLRLINQLVVRANQFLGAAGPFSEFTGFQAENASNSDVTLVAGQYLACFEAYRARNIKLRHGKWFWVVEVAQEGGQPTVEYVAVEPSKGGTDEAG